MDFALFGAGEFADALGLCKQFGPFFVAVIFFLWRDWKREDRLSKRIDQLEDETRRILLPLVKDCAAVITANTHVVTENTSLLKRVSNRLDE